MGRLLIAAALAAVLAGCAQAPAPSAGAAGQNGLGAASPGEPATAKADAGATAASAATSPPEPSATPEPSAPAVAKQSFKGTGDKIVKIKVPEGLAAIAKITSAADRYFSVTSLDAAGDENDLLVNTVGRYSGTVLFDEHLATHSAALKIKAYGAWTVVVSGVPAAHRWDPSAPLKGTGDDVVAVSPPIAGLAVFDVASSADRYFSITAYTADSSDLVVNEIGKFAGQEQVPAGTALLVVKASGTWSIAP